MPGETVADEGFAVCKLHVFGLDVDTVDAAEDDVVHLALFGGHQCKSIGLHLAC